MSIIGEGIKKIISPRSWLIPAYGQFPILESWMGQSCGLQTFQRTLCSNKILFGSQTYKVAKKWSRYNRARETIHPSTPQAAKGASVTKVQDLSSRSPTEDAPIVLSVEQFNNSCTLLNEYFSLRHFV